MTSTLPTHLRRLAARAACIAHGDWARLPKHLRPNPEVLAFNAAVAAVEAVVALNATDPKPPPDTSWIQLEESG